MRGALSRLLTAHSLVCSMGQVTVRTDLTEELLPDGLAFATYHARANDEAPAAPKRAQGIAPENGC